MIEGVDDAGVINVMQSSGDVKPLVWWEVWLRGIL